MPKWAFDFTGRTPIIEDRPIKIEKQLTEETIGMFGQRQVLTLARYMDTNQPVMVKIRYDLNPKHFNLQNPKQVRKDAKEDFMNEWEGVETVQKIGHGPEYIDHFMQKARPSFPYPNGKVYFLILSRVPGENVAEIYKELSFEQLESIRRQIAYILEHMRQDDWALSEQDPNFLRYDREQDKLLSPHSLCFILNVC
ncbi:hypothetical protein AWENTII_011688 [Aspergillus wentii]